MGPTGSIFGRSSRTRWSARARLLALGTVAGLVMLAAARAHADWRTDVSVKGKPNDVLDVWASGNFAVGFDHGAHLFVDGGLNRTIDGGSNNESAGTYYKLPEDCFVSARKDVSGGRDSLNASGGSCGGAGSVTSTPADVQWVRHAADGGAVALAYSYPGEFWVYTSDTSIYDTGSLSYVTSVNDDTIRGAFGVVRIGDRLYTLIGSVNPALTLLYEFDHAPTDPPGGAPRPLNPPSSTPMGAVTAVELFAAGSPAAPHAVVGTEHGFLQGSIAVSSTTLQEAQVLDAGVNSLSMNVGFGGGAGTGFGMAVVSQPDGGGARVMGAVPMLSDTEAGTVWRDRTFPVDAGTLPLKHVACVGASYCVFTAEQADTHNVFIYTNAAGPTLSVGAPEDGGVETADGSVTIPEGRSFQLLLQASDPDGDPVLVTATPASASDSRWSVVVPAAATTPGEPIQVAGTTGKVCQTQTVGSLDVYASDGLRVHEAHATFPVSVKHTVAPPRPVVRFSDGGVLADGEAVTLRAGGTSETLLTTVADTGCATTKEWTASEAAGTRLLTQGEDGGTHVAVFTPPSVLCQVAGEDFHYQFKATDEGGLFSSQGLTVHLETEREPFDPGAFAFAAEVLPSGELRVSVDSPLNCKSERMLRAEVQLPSLSADGGPLTTTLELPDSKLFPLDGGCQGGPFQVKATLVEEETGLRGPETTRDMVLPRRDARLESLPAESALVARCGEGARATLTQTFPVDACQSSSVTWSQVDGPPLEQTALSGNTVSLATRDTGLDSLVGRSVVVRVTANAGPGNEASIEHTLPITVEPFVKVRRRTEVPAASETGLVGVSVDLLNTTACGVTDVSYVERLEGLTYVEGSAKFDGQPVEATWEDGALTVKGLALAGEGSGKLTYVARPHLVGDRRFAGEARLREVPISLIESPGIQVPDSGCGCTSSGPGPVVFALGVLGAAVRRRRRA